MTATPLILIVDDDLLLQQATVRVLDNAGYRTCQASDGLTGLQIARDQKPALALLDVNLPDMSGVDVCRLIKADPTLTGCFVVLLSSARIDSQSQAEGLDGGADGYIARPVTKVELLARVRGILRIQQAEQALQRSEERMQLILRSSNDALWDWILEKNDLYYSPHWSAILGYDLEELPVDPNQWEHFVHPADRSLVDQVLGSALKTGQDTCEVEFRLRHKDGHYVPILLRGFILRDANGKPVRVSGTNIDMSERKQAEDLLRRSEKKLRNIINGTNAGTWEWNVQTGETIFDEKSVAILGYSLEEFQPISFEKWMRLKSPEDKQTSIELLEKHLQGKTDYYSFESKMKHKDGHWVWVLGQGIVVEWDNNGKPLWMSGMHIDITKRKCAEESLRESEKRYRTLVDTSPDAIIYISPGMQVILCNQRAADLYGVENPGQMLGMSAFNLFGPENNSWITENIARLPKGWSMRGQEFALSRQDGSLFPAEVGASLVVNEMDEPIGIISVVRDITLRKQMEQYVGRSERLTVMGQISAELAHEIKNPLQSIQSNLELMLDFALDPHEGQEHLRLCYTEIERLVELTNRLLNLSNPNKTYSQPVSVSELFKRILALVEKSAREMGMNINLVVPDGFPPVLTDPDQMIQVLLNLSINAIEAMPRGGQLTLSAEAVDESVRLNVINDGNIIPANRLENIFELFYTTKSRGTGLGLPISFNIIQKMGGRLSAENLHDPDRVQFTITLPASTSGIEQEWSS